MTITNPDSPINKSSNDNGCHRFEFLNSVEYKYLITLNEYAASEDIRIFLLAKKTDKPSHFRHDKHVVV